MNKLVVGNLVHRPLRSLISCLAIAIEVIMILSITAILMGKLNGFKDRTNGIGMDMFVRPSTTNNFIGMSPAGASIKVADVLAQIPHIKVVAPVNIQITSSLDNIYGIDFKSYDGLLPFVFLSGGLRCNRHAGCGLLLVLILLFGVLILIWANTPHARARRRDTRIPAPRPRHYRPGWQPWQDDD